MIRSYTNQGNKLVEIDNGLEQVQDVIWYDLFNPTDGEEEALESYLEINIPTREEMDEIEVSSRLFIENGTTFMTVILPASSASEKVEMQPVTFVLSKKHLVTIRYHDPRAFQTFPARAARGISECNTPEEVQLALLEATVDRLADILENVGRSIDEISHTIFRGRTNRKNRNASMQDTIEAIGRKGELTSNIRDSLATFERLTGFLSHASIQRGSSKQNRERVKTLTRDVRSLSDHSGFLNQKVTFLLDATLGMINIEQNAIIKIFSVAAVVFLPPTLIASIYGMNFIHMPELNWLYGYPFAIGLMVLCAILPYLFFKRRGWL